MSVTVALLPNAWFKNDLAWSMVVKLCASLMSTSLPSTTNISSDGLLLNSPPVNHPPRNWPRVAARLREYVNFLKNTQKKKPESDTGRKNTTQVREDSDNDPLCMCALDLSSSPRLASVTRNDHCRDKL